VSEHRLSPEGRYKCAIHVPFVERTPGSSSGAQVGETALVFVVHGTQRFLQRVAAPTAEPVDGTTLLGPWYATLARWRPQTALFVDEATLLPVFLPLAPARTVLSRFPQALAEVLGSHGVPADWIEREVAQMSALVTAKTANRSVVGIMNEFLFLAGVHRAEDGDVDLLTLSLELAGTPCSPLYKRHVSPDRELTAFVRAHGHPRPSGT
jgi:hypothetical protein